VQGPDEGTLAVADDSTTHRLIGCHYLQLPAQRIRLAPLPDFLALDLHLASIPYTHITQSSSLVHRLPEYMSSLSEYQRPFLPTGQHSVPSQLPVPSHLITLHLPRFGMGHAVCNTDNQDRIWKEKYDGAEAGGSKKKK